MVWLGAARSPARWADAFSDAAVAVAPWATVNAQWPQSIELASAAKRCARARIRPARPTRDAPTWPLAAIMGAPCPRWAGKPGWRCGCVQNRQPSTMTTVRAGPRPSRGASRSSTTGSFQQGCANAWRLWFRFLARSGRRLALHVHIKHVSYHDRPWNPLRHSADPRNPVPPLLPGWWATLGKSSLAKIAPDPAQAAGGSIVT